jgi:hypothetical protein
MDQMPPTKTSLIVGQMDAGNWQAAIRLAARLPRLDIHRGAILDAHMAYTNPRFAKQIGKDIDALIAGGKAALIARFRK